MRRILLTISRPQVSSALFFQYNTALVPPYQVLVDTNFLSHTVQKKLELLPTMMDCLYAKCIPIITDCVMAELEKLGPKYRIALRIARDERWERLKCGHKGTYADDCIVDRVARHKIYIVATNDRDLKRRIRKIPGVPIMSVARGKYVIERLPGKFKSRHSAFYAIICPRSFQRTLHPSNINLARHSRELLLAACRAIPCIYG